MIEASDLVWLTSSSNHAINGGSVFWGESPSGTLKTPAPSKEGADWNPIPQYRTVRCPCSNSQTWLMQYTKTNKHPNNHSGYRPWFVSGFFRHTEKLLSCTFLKTQRKGGISSSMHWPWNVEKRVLFSFQLCDAAQKGMFFGGPHPELSGCITTLSVCKVANFCAAMDTLIDQDGWSYVSLNSKLVPWHSLPLTFTLNVALHFQDI